MGKMNKVRRRTAIIAELVCTFNLCERSARRERARTQTDDEVSRIHADDDDHTMSKAEKKARKTMMKLGLKQLEDVQRVTLRKNKNVMFVINQPDVFHAPNSESYVIFGEAKVEDLAAQAAAVAAEAFKSEAPAAGAAAAVAEAEEEGEVDETGVEAKDIELVMTQANVSRAKAVTALKANPNDIVSAIMELTM